MTRLGVRVPAPGPSDTSIARPLIPGPRPAVVDSAELPAFEVPRRVGGGVGWVEPETNPLARRLAWPTALVAGVSWVALLLTYTFPTITASIGLIALAALSWSAHRAGTPVDWLRIGVLFAAVAAMAMSGYITALVLG